MPGRASSWRSCCRPSAASPVVVIVALPAVEAGSGRTLRGVAALHDDDDGFGRGQCPDGRLSDRFGIMLPVAGGAISLSVGYVAASAAANLWQFTRSGLFVGVASSATLGRFSRHLTLVHPPSGHGGGSLRAATISRARSGPDHPAPDQSVGWRKRTSASPVLRGDMLPLSWC